MDEKPAYEELCKKIEDLERRLEVYSVLVDNSPDLLYRTDLQGRIIYISPSVFRLSGYTVEEAIGMKMAEEVYHFPEERKTFLKKLQDKGRVINFEAQLKRKDGSIWWASTNAHFFMDKDGEILGVEGFTRDISELKSAEKAILESEKKYRELVEGTDDLIAQVDRDARFKFVNHKAEAIFGLSRENCVGMSAFEFIHPDDREKTEAAFTEWVRNHITSTTFENRQVNRSTGEIRHMHWTINFHYDGSGNLTDINQIARDLSEQKRIENELRESQERYSLATKGGKVGVWDWNIKTGEMFVSPNLKKMLGYNDSEIANHIEDWSTHVYAEDVETVMREANACIEGRKKEYRVEHRMVHKDGSIRWFLASGHVERDQDGRAIRFLGTDTDITTLKALEEKVRYTHKMEALGTLSGGIAHEFNNILGIIIGNTELAIDDVAGWQPAKDYLEEIHAASLRAKNVVRQILSFTRMSPAHRIPVKIRTVIVDSLKLTRATIPTTIEIRQKILCGSEMILANPAEINQILMNLCSNSVHALDKESGILKIRLETAILDDQSTARYEDLTAGEYVRLTVEDNGQGIEPEIMDRIFDPYFTTKNVDKGLGMGLAVVYGIVKKHNGAIKVTSEKDKGTTVEVLFPVTEENADSNKDESNDLPTGTERILFVDDEASLAKLVKRMLERKGYQVVAETNSSTVLKLFKDKSSQFDLIITDMAMPGIPGDRLAQELLKIRPDIPIILCTGHSDRIDEEKAKELGIKYCTMKPLMKSDLVKLVRKTLDETKGSTQE